MAETASSVRVLLSYGERDAFQNRRYLQSVDSSNATADERPMLSLYVMKNNVPDKRYVGMLSPQVDNYVCHSLVTNAWCVQAKMELEPGNVYALLVVMAAPSPSITPLRLTMYTEPELEEGSIVAKPLSDGAEWFVQKLKGVTDSNGMLTCDLAAAGDAYTRPEEVGTFQATLCFECDEATSFCSVSTTSDGKPHKQTPTYAQKQAVLSVPFEGGKNYTMVTRCITQKQEPIRNSQVSVLVYSAKPMALTPSDPTLVSIDEEGAREYVSRDTAKGIPYGNEEVPEDTVRLASIDDAGKDLSTDPAVLQSVLAEIEQQRDSLYVYTKGAIKGDGQAVLEELRKQLADGQAKMNTMGTELASAKAVAEAKSAAAASNAAASAAQVGPSPLQTIAAEKELYLQKQKVKQLQKIIEELATPKDAAGEAAAIHKQLVRHPPFLT